MARTFALLTLLVLTACAGQHAPIAGENHPANPDAGITTTSPPAPPTTATAAPAGSAHDHAGNAHAAHGHAGHDHPGSQQQEPAAADTSQAPLYVCPMHAKVTSRNPEDRCPECGMKINQRVPTEKPQ
jgi:hypothetical protein